MSLVVTISYPEPTTPTPSLPPLWRIKHDKEIGNLFRPGLPEIFPFFPNHFVWFTRPWQIYSRYTLNPRLTNQKWTSVYTHNTVLANENGFGDSNDPRRNYITGEDNDPRNQDPKVEVLGFGGSVITGFVSGSWLIVKTLNWQQSPPAELKPWEKMYCVTVDASGTPRRFRQGEQPNGEIVPIIHPFLADPVRFPEIKISLSKLQKWESAQLPDPWTLYL